MRDYHVLIVDDDAVDRQQYTEMLAGFHADTYHVQQAVNGETGLAALRSKTFDCVLLDFILPDMNGIEFLTAAVVDGALPCAFVLITGQGNEAIAVEAMKHGAKDYLVKDHMTAGALCRALAQAVSQVELQQRLVGLLRDLTVANAALKQAVVIRETAESDLRAAKEAAEQANQAKTRFVAMVTHELRTPLNGILGYAQLLRLEGGLSGRQDTQVGAMMQAGRYLLELIEGVLDFASIESGRMELHLEPVSVRDLTEACITFISPMVTERSLALRLISAHDAPRHFVTDPARLRQVLLNLLGNAVKFTNTGGVELHVLAGSAPGALRIEVIDTGRGIDEACRDSLFKDFERPDKSSSVEGTGLGLAIAARIVKLMGGTIGYMPSPSGIAPNVGSVFWFELPAQADNASSRSGATKVAPVSSGRYVLLVDDIKINRDIIGSFLDAAGHAVILAENGKDAITLAAEQPFDLILMDVRMPEIDGLEAARRIRLLPGLRSKVPILALTAYTSLDQIANCLEAGMNGHIPKPVNYETLINAIDAAIARVISSPT